MIQWILFVSSVFLPFIGWSQDVSKENELKQIQSEIEVLKQQLHQDQLEEMKQEVKGQELMIADWDAFSKKVQLIRKQEEEEKKIQKEMRVLEERKKSLQPPSSE